MSFKEQISHHIKEALKAHDTVRVSTLRMLLSSLNYREIQLGKDLSGDQAIDVLAKEVKIRQESIQAFEQGGRMDLAQKERQEAEILRAYLPAQLSDQDLESLVAQAAQECQAATPKDMGKLMKLVMSKAAGRADGKRVQDKVRAFLH